MNKEFEQFAELFDKSPNITILHINNNCEEINQFLLQLTQTFKGKFVQKDLNEIDFNRFRLTAREFEYVVVSNSIDSIPTLDTFIKEVYHSLENSAQVIIIEDKQNRKVYDLLNLLEQHDFRAPNPIDIFEKYDLVIAKKMHMWGNGL